VAYILACSDDGHVFSLGKSVNGSLGHGDLDELKVPKRIETLSYVKQVEACCDLSLVLCELDVCVYHFGMRSRHDNKQSTPKKLQGYTGTPRSVSSSSLSHITDGLAIFIICEEGSVFSFGDNTYNNLGYERTRFPQDDPTYEIKRVEFDGGEDIHISAVSISYSKTLFLTRTGNVYACGIDIFSSDNGETIVKPRHIKTIHNIIALSATILNSHFLTVDNNVVSFGGNEHVGYNFDYVIGSGQGVGETEEDIHPEDIHPGLKDIVHIETHNTRCTIEDFTFYFTKRGFGWQRVHDVVYDVNTSTHTLTTYTDPLIFIQKHRRDVERDRIVFPNTPAKINIWGNNGNEQDFYIHVPAWSEELYQNIKNKYYSETRNELVNYATDYGFGTLENLAEMFAFDPPRSSALS
jgi:hypothetical protein